MPLTTFMETPAAKEAFRKFSTPLEGRFDDGPPTLLIPPSGANSGLIGSAFDHIARFRVTRLLASRDLQIRARFSDPGINRLVKGLAADPAMFLIYKRWLEIATSADALYVAQALGKPSIRGMPTTPEKVAICCLYLGAADIGLRSGKFALDFEPTRAEADEVSALDAVFQPEKLSPFARFCITEPSFAAGIYVGGAEGDLVADATLIEYKTVRTVASDISHLRQLAGYVVLHSMGGIETSPNVRHVAPIREVAIYYARFGAIARWDLRELFPYDGLRSFAREIRRQVVATLPARATKPPLPYFDDGIIGKRVRPSSTL